MGFWKELGPGVRPRVRDAITQLRNISQDEAVNYARTLENGKRVVYVDVANTSGAEDGKTWETAYNTLTEGINAARYDLGTSTLDDDKNQHAYIFIAPGHYEKTSYTSFSGYGLHIIGVSRGNGDYGVTINYTDTCTGAPSVLVSSGAELELANLVICGGSNSAYPLLYFTPNSDYVKIHNVHFKGDGATTTYGIQFDNPKHVEVSDCVFEGCLTAGIYVNGGSDQYFIYNNFHDNVFVGSNSGFKGIVVDSDSTSYGSIIKENFFDISGAGTGAKAVDINSTSTTKSCFVVRNLAVCDSGATAFESTQKGMWDNAQSAAGTMTLNVDDD